MKKEIADRWVAALRSGKYKQGKGELHDKVNNTYCCLGVLCEIEGIKSSLDYLIESKENPLISDSGYIQSLDYPLSTLNDGYESDESLTFDEIADVIQMTWEEL